MKHQQARANDDSLCSYLDRLAASDNCGDRGRADCLSKKRGVKGSRFTSPGDRIADRCCQVKGNQRNPFLWGYICQSAELCFDELDAPGAGNHIGVSVTGICVYSGKLVISVIVSAY